MPVPIGRENMSSQLSETGQLTDGFTSSRLTGCSCLLGRG